MEKLEGHIFEITDIPWKHIKQCGFINSTKDHNLLALIGSTSNFRAYDEVCKKFNLIRMRNYDDPHFMSSCQMQPVIGLEFSVT